MKKGYDLEKIKQLCDGDTGLCNKLIAVFIDNATDYIEKMRQMVLSSNRKGVTEVAHQLIAGLGYLGASRLQNMAREIEKNMPADTEHFFKKTGLLYEGVASLVDALKKEIKNHETLPEDH
ncbi:MAG: Hpt domain-containing protein [Bacteroidales bacterium]|jgi:HPt (histidine-containing phosphotransfer) domain-containing protein|nr:Hpt domain-containing protein [Bacteroidales bacterium]